MPDVLIRNVQLDGRVTDVLIAGNRFARIAPGIVPQTECRIVDGSRQAILPPFYNAHTHAAMTLLRGYADDLELFTWLNDYIWPAEARLSEADIYAGSRLAILEMIKTGTVFFNDMYWHQIATLHAAWEMGVRAAIGMLAICGPDGKLLDRNQQANAELLREIHKFSDGRLTITWAPHSVYTVSEPVLRQIAAEVEDEGLVLHIHASETAKEVSDCLEQHGCTPIVWLNRLGLLGPRSILAHGCHITDEELELVAASRAVLAHMPISNLKLVSGIFPLEKAVVCGCRVALGTDGCSSNNSLSMFGEMKAAALAAKFLTGDPTSGTADRIFRTATRGGAAAFGIDAGEIAEGRLADAMLIDLDHHLMVGDYNLKANLVYSADSSVVRTVICNGRILMENRHVPGEADIVAAAREVCEKLRRSHHPGSR